MCEVVYRSVKVTGDAEVFFISLNKSDHSLNQLILWAHNIFSSNHHPFVPDPHSQKHTHTPISLEEESIFPKNTA